MTWPGGATPWTALVETEADAQITLLQNARALATSLDGALSNRRSHLKASLNTHELRPAPQLHGLVLAFRTEVCSSGTDLGSGLRLGA